jgi:hypothetical protein
MRRIFHLFAYLLAFACSNPSGTHDEGGTRDTASRSLKAREDKPRISTLPVDRRFIRSRCRKRQPEFTVPVSGTPLKPIPEGFLEEFIFNLPVTNLHDFSIPRDAQGLFYFNDYWENEALFVFSIVYVDESCCRQVFAITVSKRNDRILGAGFLGLSGGDGGWVEYDYGTWVNDSTLRLVKAESQSLEEPGETTTTADTTRLEIWHDHSGRFQQSKLDSVHYEKKSNE